MSSRRSNRSTFSRLYDIGGADLALRYHELRERMRNGAADKQSERAATPTPRRMVFINGLRLRDEHVTALERAWNTVILDGRYWYDRATGAWGIEGGPCAGIIQAGLPLGGPLAANASGGGTGVFVNGRELHPIDVAGLSRFMPIWRSRYWMDAAGNFGWEGGPAVGNLAAALQAASGNSQSGGPWSVSTRAGMVGGDGQDFLFFNDGKNFWST